MDKAILKEINLHKDPLKAKLLAGYFKTGKGQYGFGDVFLGLTVPLSRSIASKYKNISLQEINFLIKNKAHEVRLIALFILMYKYKNGPQNEKKKIVKFYLKNTKFINNWDLVDLSAHKILGDYLCNFSPSPGDGETLLKLARSKNLWEQRMAIISTFAFISKGNMEWSIKIAKMFLGHDHDLIHKASGWVLREVGKKDMKTLRKFLEKNISCMPRTMLRYAIEKFPEKIRKEYLKK
ncbi:MAG: DNA alkylation repair protein [Candidatus Paceibacterota bacterium]|jgi:3-methyladenine DNA glycosylase AlkD